MKCPFRIKTVKIKCIDQEETTQEFEECYDTCCAAAYIVEYNGVTKAEGCLRCMRGDVNDSKRAN